MESRFLYEPFYQVSWTNCPARGCKDKQPGDYIDYPTRPKLFTEMWIAVNWIKTQLYEDAMDIIGRKSPEETKSELLNKISSYLDESVSGCTIHNVSLPRFVETFCKPIGWQKKLYDAQIGAHSATVYSLFTTKAISDE